MVATAPTAPPSTDLVPAPPATITTSARKFRIGADSLDLSALDEEQRDDAQWLWRYCVDRDIGRTQIETLLRKANGRGYYSYDSIYQLLTGRRGEAEANPEPICRAITDFRRMIDAQPVAGGFKETRLARQLWDYCDRARQRQLVGFIFGNMTIGKTTALEEKARRDSKATFVRMPTRGHLNHFLKVIARKRNMGDRQTVNDLRDRIIDSFDSDELLIIDEADQVFSSVRHVLGLATLDFIRELWDRARCGIVFVMDHSGRDALLRGANKQRLGRLWRRRLPALNLPESPYREDLDLFAASYGLPPATDEEITVGTTYTDDDGRQHKSTLTQSPLKLQRSVLRSADGGLIVWLGILEDAKAIAAESKRAITWGAVIKAHALFVASESEVQP
jgi:DNA transposition AAA+ family ATPase